MQNVALYWLILSLTHSPIAVGLLSLARFGPFTIFGLFAGTIADRFDNRKTVILDPVGSDGLLGRPRGGHSARDRAGVAGVRDRGAHGHGRSSSTCLRGRT